MISCNDVIVLKILGYLALTACCLLLAIAGSLGGIAMFWGKPTGTGSGGIVIIALFAALISVCVAAFGSYRLMRRSPAKSRHLAFPAFSLASSLALGPLFVVLSFAALGIH